MPDFSKLIELIKKAQGDRSLNTFARDCDISKSNLSRILNNKNEYPPKPNTLKKISEHSQNNVTYDELMFAANYIKDYKPNIELSDVEKESINNRIEKIRQELSITTFEDGTKLTKETIENTLSSIEYAIRRSQNK